jgi:inositol-phosphate transport system permease protein
MSGPFLFMSPAVLLTTLFFFVPVIILFRISLTNMSTATGLKNYEMIGFENYLTTFKHPNTPVNLWTTVKYVAFTLCFFNVGMALVTALLSTHVPRRAGFTYRALWLLPRLTPSVVYIMMWKFIGADAPHGILNRHILGPLGVEPSNLISTQPFLFVVLTNGFDRCIGRWLHALAAHPARHSADDQVALALRHHLPDPLATHLFRTDHAADRRRW